MIIPVNLNQYIIEKQQKLDLIQLNRNQKFYLQHIWNELMQKCLDEYIKNKGAKLWHAASIK